MAISILFIGPKIAKKSIHKIPLKPSFLRFWRKNSIGFVQGFENCAFWSRNHLKMLDGWPFREDFCVLGAFHHLGCTNGTLLGMHQWYPCWGAPMVPFLGCTNGTLLGVHQWYPSWGAPMVPFLGCTSGTLVGVNQWLPCWGAPMAPFGARPLRGRAPRAGPPRVGRKKVGRKKCPGKLHFIFFEKIDFWTFYLSKCSDSYLERQISSRGSGSNFFIQNWLEIVRVMTFFLVSQKVAKMTHFFASISPFPMKNPVLRNF